MTGQQVGLWDDWWSWRCVWKHSGPRALLSTALLCQQQPTRAPRLLPSTLQPAKQRAPSKFAEFVRDNAAAIKAQLPAGTPHKEVMQRVAGMYAASKQQQQQQGVAVSQATAATTISLLDD